MTGPDLLKRHALVTGPTRKVHLTSSSARRQEKLEGNGHGPKRFGFHLSAQSQPVGRLHRAVHSLLRASYGESTQEPSTRSNDVFHRRVCYLPRGCSGVNRRAHFLPGQKAGLSSADSGWGLVERPAKSAVSHWRQASRTAGPVRIENRGARQYPGIIPLPHHCRRVTRHRFQIVGTLNEQGETRPRDLSVCPLPVRPNRHSGGYLLASACILLSSQRTPAETKRMRTRYSRTRTV